VHTEPTPNLLFQRGHEQRPVPVADKHRGYFTWFVTAVREDVRHSGRRQPDDGGSGGTASDEVGGESDGGEDGESAPKMLAPRWLTRNTSVLM
jgi:hypothetical protein